jgi:hypothetical protein
MAVVPENQKRVSRKTGLLKAPHFLLLPLLFNRGRGFVVLIFLSLFSLPAYSEGVKQHEVFLKGPTTVETQSRIQRPPPSVSNPNHITRSAMKRGVRNCSSKINQVTNALGFGEQTGALLMPPVDFPNRRIIPLSMEVPANQAAGYISINFAPNQSDGCGAVYEAIAFWPQACPQLKSQKFSHLKSLGSLKSEITILDGGATTKIFLMPAGSGCLSIKKEIVM